MIVAMFALREPPSRDEQSMMAATVINCRDCHGDDGLAHGARCVDLSVHCGFLLLWLV